MTNATLRRIETCIECDADAAPVLGSQVMIHIATSGTDPVLATATALLATDNPDRIRVRFDYKAGGVS